MGFHDIVLPEKFLGFGSSVGPGHRTQITEAPSGQEQRVIRWNQPRRRFDVSNLTTWQELTDLQEFVLARQGAANTFKLKDPTDFSTDSTHRGTAGSTDAYIDSGDGSRTEFQLVKRYEAGTSYERTRNITHPISGTVFVTVATLPYTEGIDFTVNYLTGVITFGSAPANGAAITAGCQFYVPVRFTLDVDEWLESSYIQWDAGRVSAPMIEDKSPTPISERWNPGGFTDLGSVSTDTAMDFTTGRFVKITPTAALNLRLPDVNTELFGSAAVQSGGPYWTIWNAGSFTVTLQEYFSGSWRNLLISNALAAGKSCDIFLDSQGIWRRR